MASEDFIARIRYSIVGDDQAIWGPFGARRTTYADYAASGRALSFIESFIRHEVLPHYANTHTETTSSAMQTTKFREEARKIIHQEVDAGTNASVIFCGSGATAAIAKIIGLLGLRLPEHLESPTPPHLKPLVLVGPYEHHSNFLSWRESVADVIVIREDHRGHIDMHHLESELIKNRHRGLVIGSFSAASNVTGIMTDVPAVTAMLKRHGALAFFDYAASGSHVKMSLGQADALFISPHKFIGGVGTPGVLVVRNTLLGNRVPVVPGGGTVTWVSDTVHDYIAHATEREEGGTPDIVGSIRAGLAFQLKAAVGYDNINQREHTFLERALEVWGRNPNIKILGNKDATRTSIVSFLIRSPNSPEDPHSPRGPKPKRYLHYNYVVALLNDLFGIQARGGCSCAGPYSHRLLNIGDDLSEQIRRVVAEESLYMIKPGWTRVTFSYFLSETVFNYILKAVDMIASEGWKLLPQYVVNPRTATWTHRLASRPPLSLNSIVYDSKGRMGYDSRLHTMPESALARHLQEAQAIFAAATQSLTTGATPPLFIPSPNGLHNDTISPRFERLRWFDLPRECMQKEPSDNDTVLSDPGIVPPLTPESADLNSSWSMSPRSPPQSPTAPDYFAGFSRVRSANSAQEDVYAMEAPAPKVTFLPVGHRARSEPLLNSPESTDTHPPLAKRKKTILQAFNAFKPRDK